MFVLDVLRHDVIENATSIVQMLNDDGCIGWRDHWDRDFTKQDVLSVLGPLVEAGLVRGLRESAERGGLIEINSTDLSGDDVWFELTAAGRKAWDAWEPPPELSG